MRSSIDVSTSLGSAELVVCTITDIDGGSLANNSLDLSLGSFDDPGEWKSAIPMSSDSPSVLKGQILVDESFATGSYWLWFRLSRTPEVIVRRAKNIINVS